MYMEKHKKIIQKHKSEISAQTCNEKFELLEGSYSLSDIKDYFDYIITNMKNDW